MKKFFKYMALAAVALVTTTAFTACGDDDDDNDNNSGKQTTSTITTWQWQACDTISSTLTAVFDYTTTVTLPDGTTRTLADSKTNEITSLTDVLAAANLSYPAQISIAVTMKLTEGYTPATGEKVSGRYAFGLHITGLDSKGNLVKAGSTSFGNINTNLKLDEWATRYPTGRTLGSRTLTINKNADGSYSLSR